MFVIGATKPEWFNRIRAITPNHFFLVPGLGAQGGSLQEISEKALNKDVGLLVNASRAIIYAGSGDDFAEKAGAVAAGYASEMASLFNQKCICLTDAFTFDRRDHSLLYSYTLILLYSRSTS